MVAMALAVTVAGTCDIQCRPKIMARDTNETTVEMTDTMV